MKNKLFQNFEHFYNAVKFLGLRGVIITLHFVWVCLVYKNSKRKGEYKFSGLVFKYENATSLIELFTDLFTLNPYFFIANNLDPIIVDIGGNIGDSLLYFKYLYPNSKVYVFEPLPESYELLQQNISINKFKNVKTFQEAVSNNKGELLFYSERNGDSRKSSSDKAFLENVTHNSKNIITHKVKQVKISQEEEIKKLTTIDLLKIDAEGHESRIIADLYNNKMLAKVKKIIIEYHFMTELSENSLDGIVVSLLDNGFKLSLFNYFRYTENVTDTVAFMISADRA